MSITVKNLIEKYSNIQEGEGDFNLPNSYVNVDLGDKLSEEEYKVLSALNMGIVTEKVLNERRASRS